MKLAGVPSMTKQDPRKQLISVKYASFCHFKTPYLTHSLVCIKNSLLKMGVSKVFWSIFVCMRAMANRICSLRTHLVPCAWCKKFRNVQSLHTVQQPGRGWVEISDTLMIASFCQTRSSSSIFYFSSCQTQSSSSLFSSFYQTQ